MPSFVLSPDALPPHDCHSRGVKQTPLITLMTCPASESTPKAGRTVVVRRGVKLVYAYRSGFPCPVRSPPLAPRRDVMPARASSAGRDDRETRPLRRSRYHRRRFRGSPVQNRMPSLSVRCWLGRVLRCYGALPERYGRGPPSSPREHPVRHRDRRRPRSCAEPRALRPASRGLRPLPRSPATRGAARRSVPASRLCPPRLTRERNRVARRLRLG